MSGGLHRENMAGKGDKMGEEAQRTKLGEGTFQGQERGRLQVRRSIVPIYFIRVMMKLSEQNRISICVYVCVLRSV